MDATHPMDVHVDEDNMLIDRPPSGPIAAPNTSGDVLTGRVMQVGTRPTSEHWLRENALLVLFMVVRYCHSPAPALTQIQVECKALQSLGYVGLRMPSSREYEYTVNACTGRYDPWFVTTSVSLIERFLAWVLG